MAFRDLNLIIDVKFQIFPKNVPILKNMKYKLDNDLKIST